ncbi:uncharacterized protein LY79DRAFT_582552 [Colletotrichum navitas]|uniref:Uncharacterized protein n=1 Tax=Colletotrichum navitas TaxID=681940 RepID=A0AAD8PRG9_9PEZI|nr:uncharacterized protein LY79DRAFT_582552 [Colletotrichum navitas]KAK1579363.1 hypothetical protein LY79DRAFT_582552 [Colletotrichum navitas]
MYHVVPVTIFHSPRPSNLSNLPPCCPCTIKHNPVSQSDDLWGFIPRSAVTVKEKLTQPVDPSYIGDHAIWQCLEQWMEPPVCGKAFYFDTRGDLTLKVGDSEKDQPRMYELIVCSRPLASWSPVLRAMLFTGLSESRPKGEAP